MVTRQCSNCIYGDICVHGFICDDYAPLDETAEYTEAEELIESGREAFHAEWIRYIAEYEEV